MNIEIPKEFFTVSKNLFKERKNSQHIMTIYIGDRGIRIICGIDCAAVEFSALTPSMSGKKIFTFNFPNFIFSGKTVNLNLDYNKGIAEICTKAEKILLKTADFRVASGYLDLLAREKVPITERFVAFNPRYYKNLELLDETNKHSIIANVKNLAGCPSVFSWVKPLESNAYITFILAEMRR